MDTTIERTYAPEFIGTLADNAEQTLHDWLEANGAPEQVTRLLSGAIMLERAAMQLENHTMNKSDLDELTENLGEYSQYIAELGGVFSSSVGETFPRKNIIKWQPAQNIEQG